MSEAVARIAAFVAANLEPSIEPLDPARWAQPFVWRDPTDIPPRRWLYKPHLIRGFVSLTVSPGGVGKSTLTLCEALAIASGRSLLGILPSERTRVWCWNGEDPAEEIERRIQAAMIHHQLKPVDLEGWLFTGSGRDADLVIAEQDRNGISIAAPVVDALVTFIAEHQIGLVVIDPFVSSHRVAENDNGAIDRVVKTWAKVANITGCTVELVHHTRKTGGAEVSVEDGRGASALLAAARYARTLRAMNEKEADYLGVQRTDREAYVRIDGGKANLSPPASGAFWFRLANVHLPNGDYVQAAAYWTPPDPFEGVTPADLLRVQEGIKAGRGENGEGWRSSYQTGDAWVGHAVAEALDLDASDKRQEARLKELLRLWLRSGALMNVDRRVNAKGKKAPFVEVGRWAEV
jgi:AAA domain